jgi:putative salt-induced outer membrane protein YdiY
MFLMRFAIRAGVVLALCFVGIVHTRADEILFNNGDRITGKILSAADGKLKIKTSVAGEVTVEMKDVKTFTTDEPVTIKLKDGNVINDKVSAATTQNAVQTAGTGGVAAQNVDLTLVEKVNAPPVKWTGSLVAGALISRGNTESEAYNINFDATRRADKDRITFGGGYFFGKQTDPDTGIESTTTDNWFLQGKYDYFFSKKWYGYANTRVERDRIAELDLRVTPGVGVGYQWVESADFNFNTEAGLTWVYEDYTTGGTDEHFAGRLAYHLDKRLNDKVKLFHNLEYLPSLERADDFNVNSDLGLRATLTGNMFGEAKVEWKYDATPAPGADKNDLRWILGVGWNF